MRSIETLDHGLAKNANFNSLEIRIKTSLNWLNLVMVVWFATALAASKKVLASKV